MSIDISRVSKQVYTTFAGIGLAFHRLAVIVAVVGGFGIVLWPSNVSNWERAFIVILVIAIILVDACWNIAGKAVEYQLRNPRILKINRSSNSDLTIVSESSDFYTPGCIATLIYKSDDLEQPIALCTLEHINSARLFQFKVLFVGKDHQDVLTRILSDPANMMSALSLQPMTSHILLEEHYA
ncbi:hypothetical protein AB6B38_10390 [Glycocaulis abyssi]|uniref:Uncharacterized protein n=1 Tax=Glycocaulis abyssi TaxID=1433403 RepID=A0ABV9NDA8_9PROT